MDAHASSTSTPRRLLLAGVAAWALAGWPLSVSAQTEAAFAEPLPQDQAMTPPVPIAPPTTPEEAEALQRLLYPEEGAADPQIAVVTDPEAPDASTGQPSRPWKLTLLANASAIFDDNIFISHHHRKADFVTTISPGVKFSYGDWLAQKGNYFTGDYILSGLLFAAHPSQDTIEQQADLNAQWVRGPFTFNLQFKFQDLSSPDIDAGNRVRRQLYQTALLNKYELREDNDLEVNFYNNLADYETRLSSDEWIARVWFNYVVSPKLTFGSGVSAGYLDVEDSPSQTYEQVLARSSYTLSDKLSFTAQGGLEIRQAGDHDRVVPILDLSVTYLPFDATQFTLTAYRRVQNSVSLAGENYTSSGFSLEALRTVRAGWDAVLAAGYSHSDYQATARRAEADRTDDFFFVRPALRFAVGERLNLEIFYLHQQNESTRSQSTFGNNQAGLRLRFAY